MAASIKLEQGKLTRMNLLVNRDDLQRLKEIYGVKSESEAARRAHELALLADEALHVADWTAAHGGLEDVHHRLDRKNLLPVEWPENDPVEDLNLEQVEPPGSRAKRRR